MVQGCIYKVDAANLLPFEILEIFVSQKNDVIFLLQRRFNRIHDDVWEVPTKFTLKDVFNGGLRIRYFFPILWFNF